MVLREIVKPQFITVVLKVREIVKPQFVNMVLKVIEVSLKPQLPIVVFYG